MKIHESKFQIVFYDTESQLMRFLWTAQTHDLNTEKYKAEIEQQVSLIEQYSPKKLYADTVNFGFTIAPELQEWNADLLFPKLIDLGVKCWAILVSKHIFSLVSIEQTMEEKKMDLFTTMFFENEEKALNWVKNFN